MAATTPSPRRSPGALTAAAAIGLTLFASVMLFCSGVLAIYRGIMALTQGGVFVATRDYVFRFHVTGWGWVHLCLGVVAVAVSFGLLAQAAWARVLGVALTALVIAVRVLSAPYYLEWSLLLIVLYGLIIWALCVSGRRTFPGLGRRR
ncbi:DUF7144 family membrane protein [Streptomyces sp. NPDC001222]|uniref:DUF7144 family membrane protein n=1 Tax=Streptomyces sp. NPDC001222 TaxID=3364548 RepID=UPI0036CB4CBF